MQLLLSNMAYICQVMLFACHAPIKILNVPRSTPILPTITVTST